MKTRFGFVSNSSSSSFVIIGRRLTYQDLDDGDYKDLWMVGQDMGEGRDIFQLSEPMIEALKACDWDVPAEYFTSEFFDAIKAEDAERGFALVRDDLPAVTNVFMFERSYHSTQDINQFLESYTEKMDETQD